MPNKNIMLKIIELYKSDYLYEIVISQQYYSNSKTINGTTVKL